jgi:hypothetical protein
MLALLVLAAVAVFAAVSGLLGFDSRDGADWAPARSHNR